MGTMKSLLSQKEYNKVKDFLRAAHEKKGYKKNSLTSSQTTFSVVIVCSFRAEKKPGYCCYCLYPGAARGYGIVSSPVGIR